MTDHHIPADTRALLETALERIKVLTEERKSLRPRFGEPVAIVGMGARMPGGADSPGQLWDLLAEGRDAVAPYPATRLADVPGGFPDGTPSGGFLDRVDGFDAEFFGVSPREAACLDPQQRLLLEVAWEALENAGTRPASLRGSRTGVYVGVTNNDYQQALLSQVDAEDLEAYALTGAASTFAAGRIAYWLGAHGPSLSVDTACSSSLVAVHLAVQALRCGEADVALAGGVNVLLAPEWYSVLGKAGMLAADAHCKTFDAAADGYVRSEGCGVVVLKRLSDARADGNRVLAVIRGTAVNQDGRSSGVTVPNAKAQRDVVRAALASAGLEPHDIDYVETHGTGTPLGDPIEVHALSEVLATPERERQLLIGSVKSNLGHLEPAAGVAGLLKVVLGLTHETLPGHIGLRETNPEIDLTALNMAVPTESRAWARGERTRRAGISSFGASGTNAHIIVEEAPAWGRPAAPTGTAPSTARDPETWVLPLSARTPEGVAALARGYLRQLDDSASGSGAPGRPAASAHLADLAYTAGTARDHFPYRRAAVAATPEALREELSRIAGEEDGPATAAAPGRARTAWLFTGQGTQYPGMGAELFAQSPVFRLSMEHCAKLLDDVLDRPLLDVVFGAGEASAAVDGAAEGPLHDTRYTQPALVALEWSLAQMWRAAGLAPDVVVGHSVGELAAAAVAGVLDIADALRVAAARGRLMQERTEPGAMAAVFASADTVRALLVPGERVALAAFNGPEHVVVSGPPAEVDGVLRRASERGLRGKRLASTRAFHSSLMEPMLDAFAQEVAGVAFAAPDVPLVSTVTGNPVGPEEWNADYLCGQARLPVDFHGAMTTVLSLDVRHVLEIGPSPTLTAAAARFVPAELRNGLWAASLRPGRPDGETVAGAVADAYTAGLNIDWGELWAGRDAAFIDAPTYPFRRTRHWYTASRPREAALAARGFSDSAEQGGPSRSGLRLPSGTGLLGSRIPVPGTGAAFLATLDSEAHPVLADCVIGGEPVVNVGFFVEAALEAAQAAGERGDVVLRDITVLQRLVYDEACPPTVTLTLEPADGGALHFAYRSAPDDPSHAWTLHSRGRIAADPARPTAPPEPSAPLTRRMTGDAFYRQMWSRRLYLGAGARWVEEISFDRDHARARLRAPGPEEAGGYVLAPGLTDAMFQVLFAPLTARGVAGHAFMVVGIDTLHVRTGLPDAPLEVRLRLRDAAADSRTLVADVHLLDGAGVCWAAVTGVTLAKAPAGAHREVPAAAEPAAAVWQPVTAAAAEPGAASPTAARPALDPLAEVTAACARSLRADPAALPQQEPLQNLGLDSLMALEIKEDLAARCGVSVPLGLFLDGGGIADLAAYVAEQTAPPGQAGPAGAEEAAAAAPAAPVRAPGGEPALVNATANQVVRRTASALVPDPARQYEPFGLTDLQQAYLFGRSEGIELGGVSTFFFLEVDLRRLDWDRLEDAVNTVVARHGMLRAVMTEDGEQRVLPEVGRYLLDRLDLADLTGDEARQRCAERSAELAGQVFDPLRWPLFQLAVTGLPGGVTRLHVGVDALVMDAWSTAQFFAELTRTYGGSAPQPTPLELTFRDYVQHLRAKEAEPAYAEARSYWLERIDTLPPGPELPLSADPSTIGRPDFAHLTATVPPQQWDRFKEHAAAAGVTPSAALAAAYAETLARWSGNPHFTLTLLFFNRSPVHPEVSSVLGNFSATTLLEVDTRGEDGFAERGRRLQRQLWSDLEHSAFSGVQVLRELATRGGSARAGRAPVVFASTLNFSSGESAASTALTDHLVALTGEGHEISSMIRTPQVWLDHQVIEDAEGLRLNWDHVLQLLPSHLVGSMFASYHRLVQQLCDEPDAWERRPVVQLSESEMAPRLRANDTAAPPADGLLHHGFEKAAAARPDATALVCGDRSLSYAELDARAEALADRIAEHTGTGREQLVAVMLPKGSEQVVAAVAALKAGTAYVPVAADLPAERARRTVELSGVALVVTDASVRAGHPWLADFPVLDVTETGGGQKAGTDGHPATGVPRQVARSGDVAYVIFTSGSTGEPKGVVIEHRAALTTLNDVGRRFGITEGDAVLGLSALNFDLSVFDVFGVLAAGGTLVLPRPDQLRDPAAWVELVRRHGVTVWNSVPALLQMFVDHLEGLDETVPSLRLAMLSGDWIPLDLPDRARRRAPEMAVHSLGGATEAAIWSITHPVGDLDPGLPSVPYGKPLENQGFHVLDEQLRHRPTHVPGDLYISGDGLARGYLAAPEKTAASFLEDTPHGRLYRTGDLGRYLPDGTIEFLGRQDGQVKIQGFRIELGEIEAALSQLPGVRGAVATAVGAERGMKSLVAGVVSDVDVDADESVRGGILASLRERLPSYMVPGRIVGLDAVPVTANGKVDRQALAARCAAVPRPTAVEPPRGETERQLAELWARLLPHAPESRDQDFFALGGNSLLGVRLMSLVRTTLGVDLPLSTLFTHATVAALAEAVRGGPVGRTALVPMSRGDQAPAAYWIHPVGGDVVCYRELAGKLGMPVTGVQVPDGLPPGFLLAELADAYAAAIAQDSVDASAGGGDGGEAPSPGSCPEIRVAGWSMGGVLALEVGERLMRQGFAVAPVVAVDLMEHPDEPGPTPRYTDLLAWFARDVSQVAGVADPLAGVDLAELPDPEAALAERLRAGGVFGAGTDDDAIVTLVKRFAANAQALATHRAGTYTVPAVLVHARDGASDAVTAAWLDHLAQPLAVHTLDGDHYSVLHAERLDALASVARESWNTGSDRTAPRRTGSTEKNTLEGKKA
ncbi:amino acid adenylation domain-containing protein [Streptomyces sp. MBT56]|uniref:non-ribosomal peptide synthetase/type I polyketide synthase n=1 Tax=unclassified Streptomyces TaxID=2593676 RepID=UPI00190995A0|nr:MULTISPECIES: non-ribosomal peptide synthetase/type I polyketide synthase [unclassified Streptomyces]MBK3554993.1 amino acid adenylation domain-containing protein [Streptomyces sp. MBT56]MBK3615051.1 amino acid adenylation domain-containing protein [Streptomyces sp. MBT98]